MPAAGAATGVLPRGRFAYIVITGLSVTILDLMRRGTVFLGWKLSRRFSGYSGKALRDLHIAIGQL